MVPRRNQPTQFANALFTTYLPRYHPQGGVNVAPLTGGVPVVRLVRPAGIAIYVSGGPFLPVRKPVGIRQLVVGHPVPLQLLAPPCMIEWINTLSCTRGGAYLAREYWAAPAT